MSDIYVDLANGLEESLALRKSEFADYIAQRVQILIEESGDEIAISILNEIKAGRLSNDRMDKYADDCEYATSDEPRFYCNYVFLLLRVMQMYKSNPTDRVFQQFCDEYSAIVDSVADVEDDGYETDLKEIRAHFETHTVENSTFRGFMAKLR